MALAEVEYTATGGQTDFSYASLTLLTGVADSAQLEVYVDGVLQTITTHYTLDTGNSDVEFVSGRASGEIVTIKRSTKDDARYVTWTDGSFVEAGDLNLDSNQLFFLIQEALDGIGDALLKYPGGESWNAQGLPVDNSAPGTSVSSLATLGQVQSLVANVDVIEIDNATQWVFSGDNSETEFVLSSAPSGLTSVDQIEVFISGVRQYPTTDYTYNAGTQTLSATAAPPTGTANILVRVVTGSVLASALVDDSVVTDMIADDAVTVDKLDFVSGSANRFLVIGSTGDPTVTTIDHTMISDFDAGVRANRLDQLATASASVSLGGNQLTSVGVGTASGHAVNKGQMDSAISSAVSGISADTRVKANAGTANGSGILSVGTIGFQPDCVILTGTDGGSFKMVMATSTGTVNGISFSFTGSGFSTSGWDASSAIQYIAFQNS